MDLYVPREEGAETKPLIDRLDEAEGRIKGLLLDTANLAVAAALSTVKYQNLSFDLHKVSKYVDLSGLVRREDIVAAAEEVVKKFDFGTDRRCAEMDFSHRLGQDAVVGNTFTVSPLEAVGRRADDFHHDEVTFPRGRELVHSLGGLDATQDQVSHIEGLLSHIAVVVVA
jgi:hypothetical protein